MVGRNALGIYDSGLGGLTVLKEIRKVLPNISFYYYADTKAFPLGRKSVRKIQDRVKVALNFLFSKGCSLVILACNTASVTSVREIQQNWLKTKWKNKNALGISIPFLEQMNEKYRFLRNKKGLIISTFATHRTGFYLKELRNRGFNSIISLPDKGIVRAIESKNKKALEKTIESTLKPIKNKLKNIEYVVLACTHFPLIEKNLKKYFPPAVRIIHQGKDVALKLRQYLKKHPEYKIIQGKGFFYHSA